MTPFASSHVAEGIAQMGFCSPAGTNSGTGDFLVYVPPSIWNNAEPIVELGCYPPCTFILPPFTLPAPTVISFDPYVTTLEVFSVTATTIITYTNTIAGTFYVSEVVQGTSSLKTTTIFVPPLTTDVLNFWNMPIDDSDIKETLIAISTSILPPIVTLTETGAGTVYDRTIHPPPWPYTNPTPTTRSSDGPPPLLSFTSSAARSTCTKDCGSPCRGLFCNFPCLFDCVKLPDPDWWDMKDPHNPWGPERTPYKPEDTKCTTTSASSCWTECLASSTTSTCTSSCSISYGCSVTATSTLGTYTLAPFGYWTVDSFDRASDLDAAYASSVYADVISELADWFPETVTVTPVSTTTLPDVTVTVTPTPTADCSFWDDGFFFLFEVYNINGWATSDNGAGLREQETGCGALTGWDWHAAEGGGYASVYFNLPTILTAGCVERAIVTAGGPKLSCQGEGVPGLRKNKIRKREMTIQKASFKAPSITPTYTSDVSASHTYTPEYWNSTIPTALVNEPDGHGVVKNWMTPTPDNKTSAYTMYAVVYPTAYIASNITSATSNISSTASNPSSTQSSGNSTLPRKRRHL